MTMFELNKIAGALLFSVLIILGIQNLADVLFHVEPADPMAFVVEVADDGATAGGTDEAAPAVDLGALLANADLGSGAKTFKKCAACHTIEQGGGNGQGPALYGIVGRAKATVAGFGYSAAMQSTGGSWTFEDLFAYLEKPAAFVPGTAMNFAGVKKPNKRADLVAYLNAQGSNLPLPAAAAPAAVPEVAE